VPPDTGTSKPSSAKARRAAPRPQSIDVAERGAAPLTQAAPRSAAASRSRRRLAAAPDPAVQPPEDDARRALIAQAAYFRAERRGFAAGHEERDWLEAEAEVDAMLASAAPRPPRTRRGA
jgi:hypothetical protein